jgi:uncharacterized cupin superfamily protein
MTAGSAQDAVGILYQGGGVTHFDTREMPWDAFYGYRRGFIRVLKEFANGRPEVFLVYTPPGVMAPDRPRRHYHHCREWNYVIAGEFPVWEYESPEQADGTMVLLRDGFYMDRLAGVAGAHGVQPGRGSATGCVSLTWRTEPGTFKDEPEFRTCSEDLPFDDAGAFTPREQAGGPVVYENDAIRHVDVRALDWEPHFAGLEGVMCKVLSRFDDGSPFVYLTWTPPGALAAAGPRRHSHSCGEWILQLEGEHPYREYASADQAEGTLVRLPRGGFVRRDAGSIHGWEAGDDVSAEGSIAFHCREAAGTVPGEAAYGETSTVYPG